MTRTRILAITFGLYNGVPLVMYSTGVNIIYIRQGV